MADKKQLLAFREEYIQWIKAELLGPGSEYSLPDREHEVISSKPEKRYSIGILYPQHNQMNMDSEDTIMIEKNDEEMQDEIDMEPEDEEVEDDFMGKADPLFIDITEDGLDEDVKLALQNKPSSLGFTFFAKGDVDRITVHVYFATYRKAKAEDCITAFFPEHPDTYVLPPQLSPYVKYDPKKRCLTWIKPLERREVSALWERDPVDGYEYGLKDAFYRLASQLKNGYVRVPHETIVKLDFSNNDYVEYDPVIENINAKLTALRRKIVRAGHDNLYSVTIMLVNTDESKIGISTKCIFQPKITIDTQYNRFTFFDYSDDHVFEELDEEEKSLALQYRNQKRYATGLGTAVDWNIDTKGNGVLYNELFPEVEVPTLDFNIPKKYGVSKDELSIKQLSDLSELNKEEKLLRLRRIVQAYGTWINEQKEKVKTLDIKYHAIGNKNISNCLQSFKRMQDGIDILAVNEKAWDAFVLANRAMYMQRVHLDLQQRLADQNRYPYDEEVVKALQKLDYYHEPDKHFWRPFQIAFILMSIRSIVDDESTDRDIVDLIWYPTGGGKTEAYLGLIAFTIFYRRLAYPTQALGTTVIMRYTLRLLTAQQFTRASTLICACEFIRFDSVDSKHPSYPTYFLGKEPITIGLWIGRNHTPNTNREAKETLNELMNPNSDLRSRKHQYNKFQVLKCPWCGTKMVKDLVDDQEIGAWGYGMKNGHHFYFHCPQENCHFANTLPIQVVDDELYLHPPTLLFATVDKFAMLPWDKRVGRFFANHNNARTPELIIQDELHLISGPLGTMVGLYETAIDALCRMKGTSPKIVASTATIRRAKQQCAVLYNRDVMQFPAPGLDANDSFFAKTKTIDYEKGHFGRKYIGIMPSGITKAMIQIRAFAAVLQMVQFIDAPDEVKDQYWTVTGYFNRLKDLGKCSTLIFDNVRDFISRIAYRFGARNRTRYVFWVDELTSRVPTPRLNETFDKLEKVTYSKENIERKRYPSSVLLATNMISVGIDVSRLNVMVVVDQPKLTSEYIQATSRIGRSSPGVVFVLYNASRSRDRSHYEQFKIYHESFYRYVEPTVATPFSKPARERALHAVVVSLMRHFNFELSDDRSAGCFNKEKYKDVLNKIITDITERDASIIQRLETNQRNNREEIEEEIESFINDWEDLANIHGPNLYYGDKFMRLAYLRNPDIVRLLTVFGVDNSTGKSRNTMTSMRNVDHSVPCTVLMWEEEK